MVLNGLSPQDVQVEVLMTRELSGREHEVPPLTSFGRGETVRVRDGREVAVEILQPTGERTATGEHLFALDHVPVWCGRMNCQLRVVPRHELLAHPYEMGLMRVS